MSTRLFAFAGAIALSAASVSAQCLQWESTFATQGFDGYVQALVVFQSCTGGEPSLYAGGGFTTAGGAPAAHVARWNGSAWSQVGAGLPGFVTALCAYDDGSGGGPELYAAGFFGSCSHDLMLAKWDGSTWTLICDPNMVGGGGSALALAVYQNELYMGGLFDVVIGGVATSDIVRWNGTSFARVDNGVSGSSFTFRVESLLVFDRGSGPELVAGGEFDFPGKSIASWNGTSWSSFASGLGSFFSVVNALAAFDGGSGAQLHAGGSFAITGGAHLARWDGAAWQSVGGGVDNVVDSLLSFGDGTGNPAGLYVGGKFANAGGSPFSRIARWDGTAWSALGTGVDAPLAGTSVFVLAAYDDHLAGGSDLYAGGNFASVGGATSPNIGEWSGCGNLTGTAFCFGDGSLATPCPCAPPDVVPSPSGAPRHGCANSFNLDGAQLFGRGSTALDNVVLTSSGQSPAAFAFFIVGTADIPAGFATADGVRCAGGAITRFGSQFAVCGSVRYPNPAAGWTLSLSTVSGTTPGSGLTKYYQVFYRNAAAGFCSPGTANFTSGYHMVW